MGREYSGDGRFPSNILLDEEAAKVLDEQSGERKAGGNLTGDEPTTQAFSGEVYGDGLHRERWESYGDSGGASRFFYVAKASRAERGEGNVHPTVKPIALMRYLIRLVSPPGAIVLDPFAGSGTTAIACHLEGVRFLGFEREEEYHVIACTRIKHWTAQGRLF